MKITCIDVKTKKPADNKKIQLQVKGKDSGFVTCSTDANGKCEIDDKYQGQQISFYIHGNQTCQPKQAHDGMVLDVDLKEIDKDKFEKEKDKNKEKEPSFK